MGEVFSADFVQSLILVCLGVILGAISSAVGAIVYFHWQKSILCPPISFLIFQRLRTFFYETMNAIQNPDREGLDIPFDQHHEGNPRYEFVMSDLLSNPHSAYLPADLVNMGLRFEHAASRLNDYLNQPGICGGDEHYREYCEYKSYLLLIDQETRRKFEFMISGFAKNGKCSFNSIDISDEMREAMDFLNKRRATKNLLNEIQERFTERWWQ
jgi:hypothetical protein